MRHYLGWVKRHVRSQGVVGTAKVSLMHLAHLRRMRAERRFDRENGTDTGGIIKGRDLGLSGDHAEHATDYEGIQIPVFRDMMRDLPIDHRAFVFVDLGSGKGRALILAADWPFRKVIGVEMSPLMHEVASRNIDVLKQRRRGAPIELHFQDAASFEIPDGNCVLFLYNPFGPVVIARILRGIERSLRRKPRLIYVLYRNPLWANLFDREAFLTPVVVREAYRIYQGSPARGQDEAGTDRAV